MLELVSENLQPFDKRAKDVFSLNENALANFVTKVEKFGVKFIDVNLGHLNKNKEKIVSFFIKNIEKYSSLNILIDSTDSEVIEIAINTASKKPIINAFSYEEKKLVNILPLAKKYDCKIIGLVMADGYIPTELDDKLYLAEKMVNEAEKLGIDRDKIILDPIIAPLGWTDGVIHNKSNLEFIKFVPQVFGEEVKTICGLSNLTTRAASMGTNFPFQSIYLSMLYTAGISMVMIDIFNKTLFNTAKFINTLDEKRVFSFGDFIP